MASQSTNGVQCKCETCGRTVVLKQRPKTKVSCIGCMWTTRAYIQPNPVSKG